jgi:hypothetical protein
MLKPLDSAQFIWAAESRHSGSVPDNRDFRPAKRRLIDTLSKRRNGISSSYPDLLDPSFGSCLRGESSKEGKKNGGRTLYHFQIKSSSKSDRKLFIYAQIIEFDSIFA